MTEKELAFNICQLAAKEIVDGNGGVVMGGFLLGEEYAKRLYKAGGYDLRNITAGQQALRHWVAAVGYDRKGNFKILMSDTIQNC